jgi:hypothetical protein
MRNELLVALSLSFAAACNAQLRDEAALDAGSSDGGGSSRDAQAADGGGRVEAGPRPETCAGPGICTIAARTCCGVCGAPTLSDVVALRWDRTEEYRNGVCGGAGPVPCPACASMENPHLTAVCRASTCAAIDVRLDDVSACASDADCMLRYGTGCCERCGSGSETQLTAFRRDALRVVVRCLPNEGACPECVATYPPNARAACNARTKHCEVRFSP